MSWGRLSYSISSERYHWDDVSVSFASWNPRLSLIVAWCLMVSGPKFPEALTYDVPDISFIDYAPVTARRVKRVSLDCPC